MRGDMSVINAAPPNQEMQDLDLEVEVEVEVNGGLI